MTNSTLEARSASVAGALRHAQRREALTSRATSAAAGCVLASALLFVWGHRFLPLQDYPDWLLQGELFADLLQDRLCLRTDS